jgi:hypothetical protein
MALAGGGRHDSSQLQEGGTTALCGPVEEAKPGAKRKKKKSGNNSQITTLQEGS